MKWIIRPAARRDIARYAVGYALEADTLGARFRIAVENEVTKIAAHPELLGHQMGFRKHAGLRSRVVTGFPHLIFYVVHPKHVEIKRVLHGARNLPKFFSR